MDRSTFHKRHAFSFSEVLAVMAILGAVAAMIAPRLTTSADLARQQADEQYRAEIGEAVERFYINESRWPAFDLSDIGEDPNYFPKGVPANPMDGTAYSLDPTTYRIE